MSGASRVLDIHIGSFNIGIHQSMLTCSGAQEYIDQTEHIIATCAKVGQLHIMNLCELGGHRQGFAAANINEADMGIFRGTAAASVSVDSNYLTAWGFDTDTPQFGVRATRPSKTFWLTSKVCEPELIVHAFKKGVGFRLILGNLHIRIPQKKKVKTTHKQKIVAEALRQLENEAVQLENEALVDSATQPIVLVLVGDCNLVKETAMQATQPLQPEVDDFLSVWHVHRTEAGKSGDLMFVKGAHADIFELPFGVSHDDRGARNDNHDAIGIQLRVRTETKPEPAPKRNRMHSGQSERFGARTDYGFPACKW